MARRAATKAKATTAAKPKRKNGNNPDSPRSRDTAKGAGGGMKEGSPTLLAKRRELISSARLRGATYSQIEALLIESGFKNPSRGKPWSRGIIADDLKVCRDEWMANAAADIKEHYSRVLAELAEVKRAAWAAGERDVVLRAISQECKMLGFNAPVKLQISQQPTEAGEQSPGMALAGMNVEELRVLYAYQARMAAQGSSDPMTIDAVSVQPAT